MIDALPGARPAACGCRLGGLSSPLFRFWDLGRLRCRGNSGRLFVPRSGACLDRSSCGCDMRRASMARAKVNCCAWAVGCWRRLGLCARSEDLMPLPLPVLGASFGHAVQRNRAPRAAPPLPACSGRLEGGAGGGHGQHHLVHAHAHRDGVPEAALARARHERRHLPARLLGPDGARPGEGAHHEPPRAHERKARGRLACGPRRGDGAQGNGALQQARALRRRRGGRGSRVGALWGGCVFF